MLFKSYQLNFPIILKILLSVNESRYNSYTNNRVYNNSSTQPKLNKSRSAAGVVQVHGNHGDVVTVSVVAVVFVLSVEGVVEMWRDTQTDTHFAHKPSNLQILQD